MMAGVRLPRAGLPNQQHALRRQVWADLGVVVADRAGQRVQDGQWPVIVRVRLLFMQGGYVHHVDQRHAAGYAHLDADPAARDQVQAGGDVVLFAGDRLPGVAAFGHDGLDGVAVAALPRFDVRDGDAGDAGQPGQPLLPLGGFGVPYRLLPLR